MLDVNDYTYWVVVKCSVGWHYSLTLLKVRFEHTGTACTISFGGEGSLVDKMNRPNVFIWPETQNALELKKPGSLAVEM